MSIIPLQKIDWDSIEKSETKGNTGTAFWKEIVVPGVRIRFIEYSKRYLADHWCQKGHFVHCLEGDFVLELENASGLNLTKGNEFIVSDEQSSHRLRTEAGGILLIVDGDLFKT